MVELTDDKSEAKMVVTVKKLADDIGVPVDHLIVQLNAALGNVDEKTLLGANDAIDFEQKRRLLEYLKNKKEAGNVGEDAEQKAAETPKTTEKALPKITLRRKSKKVVKVGGGKTVQVEHRRCRTYVPRVPKEATPEEGEAEQTVAHDESVMLTEEPPVDAAESPVVEQPTEQATPDETATKAAEETTSAVVETVSPEPPPPATETTSKKKKGKKERGASGNERNAMDESDTRKKSRGRRSGKEKEDLRFIGNNAFADVGAPRRRKRKRNRGGSDAGEHGFSKPTEPVVRDVLVPDSIAVVDLAKRMAVKATMVIRTLMDMGVMATINQVIDQETAVLVVEEMGHRATCLKEDVLEDNLVEELSQVQGEPVPRAPVVTIMGHVDHGKTSLLDYIRQTQITQKEAGGITQHIGAYRVITEKGQITFLDTPGHAAFTAMRARGAGCTDIVILVVAADDGVMPQTIEAIQHAKAAEVPIVVAVNKIDKPEADPDRVKNELSTHGVVPEDWGGDTMFVPVSAKAGTGVEELLDSVLIQSEVLELKAVAEGAARGVVIESRLDKGRGLVASLLIQAGQLHGGDIVLSGGAFGRVRAMHDEQGLSLEQAGPSVPVEILGLSCAPNAGDEFVVVSTERKAREIALYRQGKLREIKLAKQAVNRETLFGNLKKDESGVLPVVLKADVQGSVEALVDALTKLSTDEVSVKVLGSGVGGINESDVNLAIASKALLLGFNVRADVAARRLIEEENCPVEYFSVIYGVIDLVKKALSGLLKPEVQEEIVGLAEVREVFRSSKFGVVSGCMVINGMLRRNAPIRILRDNVVIYEGELSSLRRFKDDANEVRQGTECGVGVKNYNDIKVGDQIESFNRVEVVREL